MKQILFLFAFVLSLGNVQAQEWQRSTMQVYNAALSPVSSDLATNTDTTYVYFTSNGAAYDLHIVATYTRVSGTAGGNVLLQGSDNGTSWDSLSNVIQGVNATQYSNTPSFSSLSSGAATIQWFYVGPYAWKYKYVRARCITSGTQTGNLTGVTYYRKP